MRVRSFYNSLMAYNLNNKVFIMIDFTYDKYLRIQRENGIKWTPKRKKMIWADPVIYIRVTVFGLWTPFIKPFNKVKVTELNKRIRLI